MKSETQDTPRQRLHPASEQSILPLRKSREVSAGSIYWLPVQTMPMLGRELYWLRRFLEELHLVLTRNNRLRQESFLQMKVTAPQGPLKELLHKHQLKLMPLVGLGRKPNGKLPPIPTEQDLDPIIKGKVKFDFNEHVADYNFWFLNRDEKYKSELFLGCGGYTMLYIPPDPGTVPPELPDYPILREHPAFKAFETESLWHATFLLGDSFRENSRRVFGKGLEEEPSYEGLTFIIPYWKARDLLAARPEELEEWFTVFDVMITESPEDQGILIVSKDDLDEDISRILEAMRNRDEPHPIFPMTKEAQ